jgi:DNA mismatch repair protein MutL
MADIIQLLPDSIANQIAAGEVIQRPASVVKELMENAIDAGATSIKLIVKDAGKPLIQIVDDGCGMSETDARLSFERHATSKIRETNDLFSIRTMGFRGEALASVAAVAQVEMRTRQHSEEHGTRLVVEGSELKVQEPVSCSPGTSILVKNLFYNVPARRNFLKSNTVEYKHILDEFQRIAIANPDIFFSLHHDGREEYHLPEANLRQRLVGVFGSSSNKKLVPVEEETDILRLYGFVGKPEFAKKTRGEQYFFVNKRNIKSSYLNHAVVMAYEELLPKETYPLYVIFIDIDPARIDVNVHPTKQEIKFEDERLVYNYLKVAVRHALGRHSITPTLDFDLEQSIIRASNQKPNLWPELQTGGQNSFPGAKTSGPSPSGNLKNWEQLYEGLERPRQEEEFPLTIPSGLTNQQELDDGAGSFQKQQREPYQLHASYIVSPIKSGFLLIDQQAAHERILYEKFLAAMEENIAHTQKELFPRTIELSPADASLLKQILPEIHQLGFDIQEFGQSSFVLHGLPGDFPAGQDEQGVIESLLEQFKLNTELKLNLRDNLARVMARSAAIKRGQYLSVEEMESLIDQLFACSVPFQSPTGRQCFLTYSLEEIEKKLSS